MAEHETHVAINSDADIVAARQHGRSLAKELGFSTSDQALIARTHPGTRRRGARMGVSSVLPGQTLNN